MTMIHITLPDGTVNEYAAGITAGKSSPMPSKKHGCLAARVDGHECDLSTVLSDNCSVEGILSQSDEGMHILRHSAAHLLAQAVMALYLALCQPSAPPLTAASTTILPWIRSPRAT